ncbi:NAD(P)/FAD-dependent oxidoreductase [Clostridium fallax]|uniref:Flavoprotein, HI0933 family n=1 Tax=Clostridium fallax TaxID=1533 RepID=A0A1M4X0S4_9CLOT|nr:NAD(P)/FAD-dependent oxidoreductase [Clostridium fallax]SHE87050.1 hypothetical protein SAMN05443638_11532 [Clostridium fallax]SQB22561.1 YhiN family flavoprotein [Clostridium fallax]
MIYHDLIVLGGGASGLIAALTSKDYGVDVAIVEGTDRIGKKILTTGNGRCNISNSSISFPFKNFHSSEDGFYNNALSKFSVDTTKNFFTSIGLPIVELEKGKMYPQSLQASSVVDIFRLSIEDKNIPLYNSYKIKKIVTNKKGFKLIPKEESLEPICCSKLIIACGGKSAVKTGSDGSGFSLARGLGHNIIEPKPSLVQLKLEYDRLKALSGVKFDGFSSIYINNKLERTEFGEILFTDYGISGPPILQLSRNASVGLSEGKDVFISIDMMPNKSIDELENFLESHFAMFSHRSISDSLIGIINKKLIVTLLKEANVSNIHKPCWELDWNEKKNILSLLKCWKFKCIGTNGFQNAQVTIGGVDTKEINNLTLESKLIKNLYFCGEIIDVDGDCGGFNLQWAWSSGFVAGFNASK